MSLKKNSRARNSKVLKSMIVPTGNVGWGGVGFGCGFGCGWGCGCCEHPCWFGPAAAVLLSGQHPYKVT